MPSYPCAVEMQQQKTGDIYVAKPVQSANLFVSENLTPSRQTMHMP